jgi:DNA polymerase-4
MAKRRIIMHVDMDAFFASVEQRDNPDLQGKPVVVGGSPSERGVVAAASYEARTFGVRSAMPMAKALNLCPQAVRVQPRFQAYRDASLIIRECFMELTEKVEPLSLDEAYLDLTGQVIDYSHACKVGERLKTEIKMRTQLTASVGIGGNKFLAKIASDHQKPNGLFLIPPDQVDEILLPMPIRVIPGVGPKTEQRLVSFGIETISQLRELTVDDLQTELGDKHGKRLYELSRGIDENPVITERKRKSLSKERTFTHDLSSVEAMKEVLDDIADEIAFRLKSQELMARSIGIKIRYHDFTLETRSVSVEIPTDDAATIAHESKLLLNMVNMNNKQVRLLGIRTAGFDPEPNTDKKRNTKEELQLMLW